MAGSTGQFMHGVTTRELPTQIISPIRADSGINVVIGTAPIHKMQRSSGPAPVNGSGNGNGSGSPPPPPPENGNGNGNGAEARRRLAARQAAPKNRLVNTPRLYFNYADAVAEMGYSEDWHTFTICEHMNAAFVQYGVSPVIYVNVLDPDKHRGESVTETLQVTRNEALVTNPLNIGDSLQLRAGQQTLERSTHYSFSTRADGQTVIAFTNAANVGQSVEATYDVIDPSLITKADIIGGIDPETGRGTGLEAIEDVFLLFNVVPNILLCPGWSHDPEVASVMVAKMESINGCFKGIAVCDVDTEEVINPIDVPYWMNQNNYVFERQVTCFPYVALTDRVFRQSSQIGPLMAFTDVKRGGGLPHFSPSNKNYRMNRLCDANGNDVYISRLTANYLNANGCVTAQNFIGGWRCWGNRTSIYPASSDVKDVFIPNRRMTDFISNTVVLTVWQFVDEPGNLRLIDAIVNSLNYFFNGLTAQGAMLRARVEFRPEENPKTELLAGHYVFRLAQASPTPAEWIEFLIIFDVSYLDVLFEGLAAAA
jgi:uncharacterized protein